MIPPLFSSKKKPTISTNINNIIQTQPFPQNSNSNYPKDSEDQGIKKIVYSKRRETINDKPVYTISKETENPPEINDLFNLKVRVPRVKVSKYFKEKYHTRNQGSVLKLNDSQFLSNSSFQDENEEGESSAKKGSPKYKKSKTSLLAFNASADEGISSVVTNSLPQKPSIISKFTKFTQKRQSNPLKFPDFTSQKSELKIGKGSFDLRDYSPKKNLSSNLSNLSYRENSFDQGSASRYNKLYEKMNKIQKMRLKMVNKIKVKAQQLKDDKNKNFEANVRVFDRKAEKEIEDIFRETKFQERRKERLSTWKSKKYRPRNEL